MSPNPEELALFDREALRPFPVAQVRDPGNLFPVSYAGAMQDVLLGAGRNMQRAPAHASTEHGLPPETFAELYATLPRPDRVIHDYWRDDCFAEQRVAGVNPLVIRRVESTDDLEELGRRFGLASLPIEDLPGDRGSHDRRLTPKDLVGDGRLFVLDYRLLEGLPLGAHPKGRKYLTAPLVALYWRPSGHRDDGQLVPFAIQLGQDPHAPMFTPRHQQTWTLAKLMVQVADGNHHEMASHLARTHLAVEPFAVATPGVLPEEHPVRRFLAPFLQLVSARNLAARERLINPGGHVEDLLAPTLQGSLEIARRSREGHQGCGRWGLRCSSFAADLAARGVATGLPHYPFRDDGELLWDALGRYAAAYLDAVYGSQRVAGDAALQRWAALLAHPKGGDVHEMPSPITSREELAFVLQAVAFTSGPLHAAVNFPQYEYMTFVPNMPLAAYCPPPTHPILPGHDAARLERFLPPMGLATQQFLVMYGLSAYQHDRLGDFEGHPFAPEAAAPIAALQDELARIERQIVHRNVRRKRVYEYLMPSRIPNSASV